MRRTTSYVPGSISSIAHKVDIGALGRASGSELKSNEIARVRVSLDVPTALDGYEQNRTTGVFIIIDRLINDAVDTDMIVFAPPTAHDSSMHHGSNAYVTCEERVGYFGQQPATVLFSGLSGAGKSTLAYAVERKLFDMGQAVYVLDGQNPRYNLNKGLPQNCAGCTKNWLCTVHVAKQFSGVELTSLCAFVASSVEGREQVGALIGAERLTTVYVQVPPQACRERDPQGLHVVGEDNIPDESFPYDVPLNADLVIDTQLLSLENDVKQVLDLLCEHQAI